MKQRLLQFLLLLSVGISSAVPAFPYDVVVDGIYYNLVCYDGDNYVAEVTNNGEWSASYSWNLVIPSSIVVDGVNYPVTGIGNDAFQQCTLLHTISIPESVSSIGFSMFGLFSDCVNLSSITVAENNPFYCSVDGVLYDKYKERLYCFPAKKTTTTFTVPSEVRSIEEGAFAHCENLVFVSLPSTLSSLGAGAFMGCTNLIHVNIPEKVDRIYDCLFEFCKSLKAVIIPNGVHTIGVSAFYGSGLENIILPNSVTTIERGAFTCNYLKSITLGNSISTIESSAFGHVDGFGYGNSIDVHISDLTAFCNIHAGDWFADSPIFPNGFSLYLNDKPVVDLEIPNTVKELRKNLAH